MFFVQATPLTFFTLQLAFNTHDIAGIGDSLCAGIDIGWTNHLQHWEMRKSKRNGMQFKLVAPWSRGFLTFVLREVPL